MRAVFIAVGIALLVVAVAWRARDHRRRHSTIEAALRSADPFTRTRALREIASSGLRPWASMLLTRTSEVRDGAEAEELVWLIGACQWEPADEPEIVQLRLWAAEQLAGTPVVASPTPVAAAPPVIEPVAVETFVVADSAVLAPDVIAVAETAAPLPELPELPARPEIIDEIESIVGAPVLAVSFVPLVGADW